MRSAAVAALCVTAATAFATPAPGLDTCSGSSDPACLHGKQSAEEDVGLLQVRRGEGGHVAAREGANGCPNSLMWSIIEGRARSLFDEKIKSRMPFDAEHTWNNQSLSYGGCDGTVTANTKMKAAGCLHLGKFKCLRAKCKENNWLLGCMRYSPLYFSVNGWAKELSFEASADGTASWGSGCKNGTGTAALDDAKTSFKVVSPAMSGKGSMDLKINPPNDADVTAPDISALSVTYDHFENFQCTLGGEKFPACVSALDYLNTKEFQNEIAEAIKDSLSMLSEKLDEYLKENGVFLEQPAPGQQPERIPAPEDV